MWIKTHKYLVCMEDPNLSMHHLLEYINQDIERGYGKDKDSTVNKTEYRSKKNHICQFCFEFNRYDSEIADGK